MISYTQGKAAATAKPNPGTVKQKPEMTLKDKPIVVGKQKKGGLKRKSNAADDLKVCGKATIGGRQFCLVVSLVSL